jgi:diguanylate cyclase (GGDEF)-like protein
MANEQDDKLNKLLARQGSIAERTKSARELDDDKLQMAAAYSPQAKEELERRRHERLLASTRKPVTDDEMELRILRQYVDQHKAGELADPERRNKCARELDMRDVVSSLIGESGPELDYAARLWHGRLVPQQSGSKGPLRPCSDSQINKAAHRHHARAFTDAGRAPAWERIRELEARQPTLAGPERELEQKFGILYSPAQMQRDFDLWISEAAEVREYSAGVIFLDVDEFKQLNTTFTESVVDRTLLPDLQRLIAGFCLHRGAAYRHGGEELVILLPNCPLDEAAAFAEKVRRQIAANSFRVDEKSVQMTVSVGVAAWPRHGDTLAKVIERANREERTAKEKGKNRVSVATA